MLLPNLFLPSRAGQTWQYSGLDSPEHAVDKQHFKSYPHEITYCYNSRGFRDNEWPVNDSELKNAIWCVGDSFTVGLGVPWEHTWPYRLSKITGKRTVNVSMDGASNQWISRSVQDIVKYVNPQYLVVMWSYTHRREMSKDLLLAQRWQQFYNNIKDESWPDADYHSRHQLPQWIQQEFVELHHMNTCGWDSITGEDLRIFHDPADDSDQNWQNFLSNKQAVDSVKFDTVHFSVPNFHLPVTDFANLDDVTVVSKLDLARDGHHFDLTTADWVAAQAQHQLHLSIDPTSCFRG